MNRLEGAQIRVVRFPVYRRRDIVDSVVATVQREYCDAWGARRQRQSYPVNLNTLEQQTLLVDDPS